MSKYTGLPDIDTAPDVFETADEPEDILRPSEDLLKPNDDEPVLRQAIEGLDETALPSRSKAGRAVGRARRKDPRIEYYASDSSSSDHDAPPEAGSTAARFRRIKAELAELERDLGSPSSQSATAAAARGNVAADPADLRSPQPNGGEKAKRKSVLPPKEKLDLWKELGGLKERLKGLDVDGEAEKESSAVGEGDEWAKKLEALREARAAASKTKLPLTAGSDQGAPQPVHGRDESASLGDLDKRLALLEGLVGPSDVSLDTPTASLQSTVARLDHLLALLSQPRQLDAISRRVKLLLVDLDRAAAASRRAGSNFPSSITTKTSSAGQNEAGAAPPLTLSAQEHQSLTDLFPLLGRLDPILPILPAVLNRLRSLASLHAEAAGVAEGLRRLQADDKSHAEELKDLQEVVKAIQGGLGQAVDGIEKNWGTIVERLKGLEERLGKLQ